MLKRIVSLIGAAAVVVTTGCGVNSSVPGESKSVSAPVQDVSQKEVTQARVVQTDTAKQSHSSSPKAKQSHSSSPKAGIDPGKVAAKDIDGRVVGELALAVPWNTLDDMARQPGGVVVVGTVIKVEDFCYQGRAKRRSTIRVEQSAPVGIRDTITVASYGGVVPHACLKETLDGKFGQKFVPEDGKFVEFSMQGIPLPKVGDQVLGVVSTATKSMVGESHHWLSAEFTKVGDTYVRIPYRNWTHTEDGKKVEIEIPASSVDARLRSIGG